MLTLFFAASGFLGVSVIAEKNGSCNPPFFHLPGRGVLDTLRNPAVSVLFDRIVGGFFCLPTTHTVVFKTTSSSPGQKYALRGTHAIRRICRGAVKSIYLMKLQDWSIQYTTLSLSVRTNYALYTVKTGLEMDLGNV